MRYLLGIDVGSSDCKALLITEDGTPIAAGMQSYPTRYPRSGWAEQTAQDWYSAACQAVHQCISRAQIDVNGIAALAVDGPAHNVALLDSAGEPLCPVIHWSDLRSTDQVESLKPSYGARIFDLTYSQLNPSWTLTQLMWVSENLPDVWRRLRKILVTKDYVRYRLTGKYQTDVYDAIGTQLYDVAAGCWSAELCDLIGLDMSCLPLLAQSSEIAGPLLPDAAKVMGLPAGIPVAVGSGDSVVEAFGIGAIHPGACIVKLGTAANVNLVTAQPYPSLQSITYRHVVDELWFSITATNTGASTMRWFRDTFHPVAAEQARTQNASAYALIDVLAESVPAGASGLLFHPYLMGERSPYWDPYLRGDFVGITARHTINHFARAIMEGVAFSIRDCRRIVEALGQPITQTYIIGGGARSRLWRQIVCDVLGQPLIKPTIEDAAFGAALVAGLAAGVYAGWHEAVELCVRAEETLYPVPERLPLYDALFEVYRAITRDLAVHNHTLARLVESTGLILATQ